MIPDVDRQALLDAIDQFDHDLRDLQEWQDWEEKGSQKFAIEHEGKRYPPKKIISLATGTPVSGFSGGVESNDYLRKRGFRIARIKKDADPISEGLENVLDSYLDARINDKFSGDHPVAHLFRGLQERFEASAPVESRPQLKVKASYGKGNWATVPWIAFFDTRETSTTHHGVYGVLLFRHDMSGVYITFNQGVTDILQKLGKRDGKERLHETARQLHRFCAHLPPRGFRLDHSIQLSPEPGLGSNYEDSTIAHKLYSKDEIPPDSDILDDLEAVLKAYDEYLDPSAETHRPPEGDEHWLFQANPKIFNLRGALKELSEITWEVNQSYKQLKAGQTGFLWESGPEGGVLAVGTLLTDPAEMESRPEEQRFELASDRFSGAKRRVRVRVDRVLSEPILRRDLLEHPVLKELGVIRFANATNYLLRPEEYRALEELITPVRAIRDLGAVADTFAHALQECNLNFGTQHDQLARAFVASLASKPFVILTGLSGSGKTQIAMRFGEWLGDERLHVAAVRPDWTGAEALFGYEDALKPAPEGRPAWTVPLPLEFLLRAAADRSAPYVLLLDEMNLAHVERYFADVLSGMESGKECLPNLRQGSDGFWREREDAPSRIPFPTNVLVIGTVNVDETTYMFSPKVLDRANTFEFRVGTTDLSTRYRKPTACLPGDRALASTGVS